jgi:hypothetical protein
MRCPWLSLSFVACALSTPLAAEAQAVPPIHVRYDAPEGCPAARAFVAQLQARTARARVAEEGQTAGSPWRIHLAGAFGTCQKK